MTSSRFLLVAYLFASLSGLFAPATRLSAASHADPGPSLVKTIEFPELIDESRSAGPSATGPIRGILAGRTASVPSKGRNIPVKVHVPEGVLQSVSDPTPSGSSFKKRSSNVRW